MPRSDVATKRVLRAMLTENTGVHFLDSGGAYGRHWEKNQGRNFDAEPRATVRFRAYEPTKYSYGLDIEYTKSTYWYLAECLEFDAKMDKRYRAWAERVDPKRDRYDLDLMESFPARLAERGEVVTGLYSDGKPFGDNSYNHDNALDQTIQWQYFETEDCGYVLLQIHGGCDVRGGYTAPRVFRANPDDGFFSDADGSIGCDNPDCHAAWNTDDAYHWYSEYDSSNGRDKRLDEYPAIAEDSTLGFLCAWKLAHGEALDFAYLAETYGAPERFVFVNEEHEATCPKCGKGKLEAW